MSTANKQGLVSVVVPFYNRASLVQTCLGAILEQRVPAGFSLEILAVDNASTDSTRNEIARLPVRLIDCARPGPGAARNAGIEAAQGEFVVFTDSDCIPQPGWLAEILAPFQDPQVLITGGEIRATSTEDDLARFTQEYWLLNNQKFFEGALCFPPFFATANAAFRRSALLQVGGFDDTIWMGEDSDLCWRIMELGGKIVYCPGATVLHEHRTSLANFVRQAQDYGSSAVHVFAKHRAQFGIRYYIHWEHLRSLARLPAAIVKRQFTRRDRFERRAPFYDLAWRTGFALGCLRGCLKWRVLFF